MYTVGLCHITRVRIRRTHYYGRLQIARNGMNDIQTRYQPNTGRLE